MEYSELNNLLENLEIEQEKNNKELNSIYKNNFNNIPNNEYFTDKKNSNIMLERELSLNTNVNYSLQIANPQRLNETRKDKTVFNSKLNDYNFNNYVNMHKDSNRIIDHNKCNINTKLVTKNEYQNSINEKINARDRIPKKFI